MKDVLKDFIYKMLENDYQLELGYDEYIDNLASFLDRYFPIDNRWRTIMTLKNREVWYNANDRKIVHRNMFSTIGYHESIKKVLSLLDKRKKLDAEDSASLTLKNEKYSTKNYVNRACEIISITLHFFREKETLNEVLHKEILNKLEKHKAKSIYELVKEDDFFKDFDTRAGVPRYLKTSFFINLIYTYLLAEECGYNFDLRIRLRDNVLHSLKDKNKFDIKNYNRDISFE